MVLYNLIGKLIILHGVSCITLAWLIVELLTGDCPIDGCSFPSSSTPCLCFLGSSFRRFTTGSTFCSPRSDCDPATWTGT